MNRTYRLQFCRQCKKRAFSSKSGIICSLTNEQADFQDNCSLFEKDDSIQIQQANKQRVNHKKSSNKNLENYFHAFLITLYLSIAILIVSVIYIIQNDSPAGLIIGGLVSITSTVIQVILLYNIWDYIITEYKLQGEQPPVESAGKAIGYLFIPFYNFYWIFIAYGKIMESLNQLAESRNKELHLPVNLGMIICIFTLTSIIPIVGTLLALISTLVLIPIFFSKAIQAIKEIPPLQENETKSMHQQDHTKVQLSEIRSFSELFDTSIRGFNYKLVIIYLIGIILNYSLINLINSQFRNVFLNAFFLIEILFQGIFIFLFIYLSRVIKNIVLVLSVGTLTVIKNTGTFFLYYLFMNRKYGDFGLNDFIKGPYFIGYFLYGVLFITFLMATVKFFGVRYWAFLIYGFCLNCVITLTWIIISQFTDGYNFEYTWINLLFVPLIHSVIIASSLFLGFSWYFNSPEKPVYSRDHIDMLDSGL